jgi:hypothetical protein
LSEFGNIIAPRLRQPAGMRGPEIHISDGGYGFRARWFHSRAQMCNCISGLTGRNFVGAISS